MKMSIELYNNLKKEVCLLNETTDLKTLQLKMIESGNSQTRFALDIFYMIRAREKYNKQLNDEKLNDSHIKTVMKKILKEIIK